MNFICFDLEGPLSPQDNAYELMKLIPDGGRIFEVISRYDDLLAIQGKKGYEPGDTLALIAPFVIYNDISEDAMRWLSERATLVNGAHELVTELIKRGWWVGDITTSYQQYGYPITQRVGFTTLNVACTYFPLDQHRKAFRKEDLGEIKQLEQDLLQMHPVKDDQKIKKRLDSFYWGRKANPTVRAIIRKVKPLGGNRKVAALKIFAEIKQVPMNEIVVVGDSITDFRMLQTVKTAGELAVAFNANEYALKYATMSLASTHISDLMEVLLAWEKGGRDAAESIVKEKEECGGTGNRGYFHWLLGRENKDEVLKIHARIRRLVREEAGKLG